MATKKNTPKVTNKVKRMDATAKAKWFAENCSKLPADEQAKIKAKMASPLTVRKVAKIKDYNAFAASLSLIELASVKTVIDKAYAAKGDEKAAAAAKLREELTAKQAQLATLES